MKVTRSPDSSGSGAGRSSTANGKPRKRFSDLFKDRNRDDADSAGQRLAAAPVSGPALPSRDLEPVNSGVGIAPKSDVLVASLVQEIAVAAPPGGGASVDIQFDSRTLQGLHVRIQKTSKGVEVRLSTSSEAVSRLLAANTQSLTDALAQRGYIAPAVSVQRVAGPSSSSAAASGRSARDGRDRGGNDRGSGQKRR